MGHLSTWGQQRVLLHIKAQYELVWLERRALSILTWFNMLLPLRSPPLLSLTLTPPFLFYLIPPSPDPSLKILFSGHVLMLQALIQPVIFFTHQHTLGNDLYNVSHYVQTVKAGAMSLLHGYACHLQYIPGWLWVFPVLKYTHI